MSINTGKTAYDTGDYSKALEIFKPMAEQGNAVAQLYLGFMYRDGDGVNKNVSEGIKWLLKAAKQGNEMAQYNLGEMYLDNKNAAEGLYWLRKVAETGEDFSFSAIESLAERYKEGDGVKQDVFEAARWLQKGVDQDPGYAAYNLARIYFDGEGTKQDYVEAAKWFHIAAENNFANSHYNIGQMYLKGLGVTQSDSEAAKWFCIGAKADPDCKTAFADLFKKGVEVSESECDLVAQYKKAINEGDEELQVNLGLKELRFSDLMKDIRFIYFFFGAILFLVGGSILSFYIIEPETLLAKILTLVFFLVLAIGIFLGTLELWVSSEYQPPDNLSKMEAWIDELSQFLRLYFWYFFVALVVICVFVYIV